MIWNWRRDKNKKNVQTLLLCYISFQLYKVITLKRSINGLISVIILKRTLSNISLILPIYRIIIWVLTRVRINSWPDTQIVAVLTYLCTLCFLLRASDWSSNVQRRKCRTLSFTRNCPVTSAPWVWISSYPLPTSENGTRHIIIEQLDIHSSLVTSSSEQLREHIHNYFKFHLLSLNIDAQWNILLPSILDSLIYEMKGCFCIFT